MSGKLLSLAMLFGAALSAGAQEWPRFRGPNGDGIGAAPGIAAPWDASMRRWRVALPGKGHSSPVIIGQRLYITSADSDARKRYLTCLDAVSGKTLWQHEEGFTPYREHPDNSYAAATPVADETGVWVSWINPDQYLLQGFSPDGKPLWSIDLGPFRSQHMNGSSPILAGDLVVLSVDQERPDGSFVIGVDRKTGQVRWKTPRTSDNAASATPCLLERAGKPSEVILSNRTEGLVSLDAATGRRLWQVKELMPFRCVASPIAAGGRVIVNCGEGASNRFLAVVQPPEGPQGQPRVVYTLKGTRAPYVPTPVAVGKRLYILTDAGMLHCAELASGRTVFAERIHNAGSAGFYASPVCVDDRLLCVSRRGELIVLSASDRLAVLGRCSLEEPTFATPAVAHGRIYLRTLTHLLCVAQK